MVTAYLAFNAFAYVILGLWCAVSVEQTAASIGYTKLDRSGKCEYTAVYGGLQIALGLMFGLFAMVADQSTLALQFACVLYASLVVFRAIGLLRFWPVASLTVVFAGFELLMLVLGLWLLLS